MDFHQTVCALILWRSGLELLMGKFCQFLIDPPHDRILSFNVLIFVKIYYRTPLTGLLYTITAGDYQVVPDYIPVPVSQTLQNSGNTRGYSGDIAYRVPDLHHIRIKGSFNKTTVDELEQTLTQLWENAKSGNYSIKSYKEK